MAKRAECSPKQGVDKEKRRSPSDMLKRSLKSHKNGSSRSRLIAISYRGGDNKKSNEAFTLAQSDELQSRSKDRTSREVGREIRDEKKSLSKSTQRLASTTDSRFSLELGSIGPAQDVVQSDERGRAVKTRKKTKRTDPQKRRTRSRISAREKRQIAEKKEKRQQGDRQSEGPEMWPRDRVGEYVDASPVSSFSTEESVYALLHSSDVNFTPRETHVRYERLKGGAGRVQEKFRLEETRWGVTKIRCEDVTMASVPIAVGSFGEVYTGDWKGLRVAMKRLRLGTTSSKQREEFMQEVLFLSNLRHPYVICQYGVMMYKTNWYMVCEYAMYGSVEDHCIKRCTSNEREGSLRERVRIARDTAEGLLYLHANGVVHRDIAARNVLLARNLEVRLSDFGRSRTMGDGEMECLTQQNFEPMKWLAPEAVSDGIYSEKTDVWSFGVYLWELLALANPWEGKDPLAVGKGVRRHEHRWRLKAPRACHGVLADLLGRCFQWEAGERPSMREVRDVLEGWKPECDAGRMERQADLPKSDV